MTRIRIGSRGSDLALWQAHWVRDRLTGTDPGLDVTIEIIKTTGDRILDAPLARIGDKGLFTREIEERLLEGTIDLAVHSLKDLPTSLPDGLCLGAVTEREDVRDVFLPRPGNPVRTLLAQPAGATIATGSLRRRCLLLHARPDLAVVDLRGNLHTRYRKLEESSWAGMLLAYAGVARLGWVERIGEVLPLSQFLPAVGQGALGVEVRDDDPRARGIVGALNHLPTWQATAAERSLLRVLEGGCQVPIGTHARFVGETLVLDALVGTPDGKRVITGSISGDPAHAEDLGDRLARMLKTRGADEILASIRPSPRA
jgi:hydroxymethylbilane synthase